jgi:uncharacterized alpha-E superfamily protein
MTQVVNPSSSLPATRPMLSRDADSMYWLARYVERAEHVSRLLLINSNLLMDVGDLAPNLQQRHWGGVLMVMRLFEDDLPSATSYLPVEQRIRQFMTFEPSNPSSLLSCLTRARENARAIRENISAEMWENVNGLYWSITADDAKQRFDESPEDFLRSIMTGSMLFQGLTDQTLAHDQPWLFTQVAKYLERVDVTARVIETKFEILRSAEVTLETALRNIHWMAVLRSCCSIEAYRRSHTGELDPMRVASFLILHRTFPRSIRFCVDRAWEAVSAIRTQAHPTTIDPAERVLGRLNAQLEYAEMNEVLEDGLPAYLQNIQIQVAEAAWELQHAYFMH